MTNKQEEILNKFNELRYELGKLKPKKCIEMLDDFIGKMKKKDRRN